MTIPPEHIQILAGYFTNSGKNFWADIRDGAIYWIMGLCALAAIIALVPPSKPEAAKKIVGWGGGGCLILAIGPDRIITFLGVMIRSWIHL